jgi:hypothetical protein
MISTRTLNKWRKEALETREELKTIDTRGGRTDLQSARILVMTSELLDQNLLRKK